MNEIQTTIEDLPVEYLKPNRFQPRRVFNTEQLLALVGSIKEQGILQPIIVRSVEHDKFEIIAGERRWRAAQMAGLEKVPCIQRQCSDEEAAELALVENVIRADLNPIEKAQASESLIKQFDYTHEKLASLLGIKRTKVSNMLRLLKLDKAVKNEIEEGRLSEGHGIVLAGLPKNRQVILAAKSLENEWSVRKLEKEIKRHSLSNDNNLNKSRKNPDIARLEQKISEQLGTMVQIVSNEGEGRGSLIIQLYDNTLEGILEKLQIIYD